MVAKKSIQATDVDGRRVLMRVDFNVPLEDGRITDDSRVVKSLPAIRSVIDRRGMLVLMSHLGRPDGKPDPQFSLRPVAAHLSELIGQPVAFAEGCIGPEADAAVAALAPGGVVLLENLRFHPEETLIDKAKKNADRKPTAEQRAAIDAFATALSKHGDIYCNNAFGTCHRNHASMYDVPRILGPGRRVCGDLVERELRFLREALHQPERPFIAILGGAKVSDKIGVIRNLLPRVDRILIGGAMAYTFQAARGLAVGKSLCEADKIDLAGSLLKEAGDKLRLPIDNVCAAKLEAGADARVASGAIPEGLMGLDIGPVTISTYVRIIEEARTAIWNGPMGVFETPPFDAGTRAIATALAGATDAGAVTIIGGGDSAAAVEACGLAQRMTHISTGGGASLEFLEGKVFDTIEILDDA